MVVKKFRVYLRMSENGRVTASRKPNFEALETPRYIQPTIQIALDLFIDEKEFHATRILLEQKITNSKPCVESRQVEG